MYIVFIESNTTGTGELFLKKSAQLGFIPVLLFRDEARYTFLEKDGFLKFKTNTNDPESLIRFIERELGTEKIAGIWSSSEYYIAVVAEISSRLGLQALDAQNIHNIRNKMYQRQRLNDHHLSYTPFTVLSCEEDAYAFIREYGTPVIIKPINGSGSVGVHAIRDTASISSVLAETLGSSEIAAEWMLEKYYPGNQYSVEIFNGQILGVTGQHYSYFPRMIAVGHEYPAILKNDLKEGILAFISDVIDLFSLHLGPVHIEIRENINGILKIIEINPRLAGGFIPELIRLSSGIDLIEECIRFATGLPVSLSASCSKVSAIRFMVNGANIDYVSLYNLISADIDFILHKNKVASKHEVLYGDFRDRFGHIIICASDHAHLAETVKQVEECLNFKTEIAYV